MHRISGRCHCGNITLQVALTDSPQTYRPRACDCEFCRMHGAAYISDPDGSLVFSVTEPRLTTRYRQGSGEADMLLCGRCGVLVGALYAGAGHQYGVVNARVLEETALGLPETVSPKALPANAKVERWQRLWFRDVQGI
jgi:hypothetical protein